MNDLDAIEYPSIQERDRRRYENAEVVRDGDGHAHTVYKSFKSKIPTKITDYFQSDEVSLYEVYFPNKGWLRAAPRISLSGLRALEAQGATSICVKGPDGRAADFQLSEVHRV